MKDKRAALWLSFFYKKFGGVLWQFNFMKKQESFIYTIKK